MNGPCKQLFTTALVASILILMLLLSQTSALITTKPTPGKENAPAPIAIDWAKTAPGVDPARLNYDFEARGLLPLEPRGALFEGVDLRLSFEYLNKGTAEYNAQDAPLTIRWYLDGTKVAESIVPRIPAGDTQVLTDTQWFRDMKSGDHVIKVVLDEDNSIYESNENNNAAEMNIGISAPELNALAGRAPPLGKDEPNTQAQRGTNPEEKPNLPGPAASSTTAQKNRNPSRQPLVYESSPQLEQPLLQEPAVIKLRPAGKKISSYRSLLEFLFGW